ncbi:MAG: LPS export ABC transporter periplasmic protein LptC [Nitrospirae bacterium]|nr:LPS export ABC transporter periplasmic protein LptC [Nitrospirota bacterium]
MLKKNLIVVLSVILAVGTIFILSYYKGQGIKLQPSFQTSSMKNLHLTHREDNQVKWELSAREAIFPVGAKEVLLTSPGIRINRTPEIRLAGGSGVYEVEKGDVSLGDSVELNIKDTTFTANTLKWDSTKELVTTEDAVRFVGKNFLIEGTGLSASMKNNTVQILRNVKATFNLT